MQDGRDMAEFGADKEKDSFWMSCTGLEGELVVQMEDDMNKDVGRLSNEDKPACCRPKTSISSQFHDNMVPLFFSDLFSHLSSLHINSSSGLDSKPQSSNNATQNEY